MHIPRNESLSKLEREVFTRRLITLHTILATDTSTEYKHQVWTQQTDYGWFKRWRTGQSCGTAACALGHAMWHRDQFPGMPIGDQSQFRDTLVREGVPIAQKVQPYVPVAGTYDYFGPNTYEYIFHACAYDVDAEEVTRQMAMDRIEQYITQHLGCQLIEAEPA